MFNKITFNSADTSTWPQFIINGGYNSGIDKPNLTTHEKYGAGLTWVGVDGRDISIYGNLDGALYVDDLGETVNGQPVTLEDQAKFWAEGQMSSFTFVNSKGNTSTVTLNWGEALADGGLLPAEESKEEPKPIEGGGDDPAELEDGEEPNEGPIKGEPGPIKGEPGGFETPTDVEGLANFLQSFNAEIIAYNEALNQIESVLIETKEGLKKTENLDEEFTTRASHVTTKVAAINVRQAEEIAAVELELDAEVTQANELKTAMQVKVTEVESRNQTIQENPVISKLTQNVSGSLRTRHNTLMTSMSKVNELMARDVVVEKASEIENAKVEREVIIKSDPIKGDIMSKEEPIQGDVEFVGGLIPTMGDTTTKSGTIKAQP